MPGAVNAGSSNAATLLVVDVQPLTSAVAIAKVRQRPNLLCILMQTAAVPPKPEVT